MSFFVTLQKAVPQRVLTEVMGRIAEIEWRPVSRILIGLFRRAYGVNLAEAEFQNSSDYKNFNHFFTRALQPGARPIAEGAHAIASPADGAISELGNLDNDKLLQAKGIYYSARELLVDPDLSAQMDGGSFATIYLSPKDYHRVHVPLDAALVSVRYVPGKLFSVNDETARSLDGLFARNERIVAEFQAEDFRFALVMVGAMIVGGIETVSTGPVVRSNQAAELALNTKRQFKKGEEFGRFHLGSTAILVFPENARVGFSEQLTAGSALKMGESLGRLLKAQSA